MSQDRVVSMVTRQNFQTGCDTSQPQTQLVPGFFLRGPLTSIQH